MQPPVHHHLGNPEAPDTSSDATLINRWPSSLEHIGHNRCASPIRITTTLWLSIPVVALFTFITGKDPEKPFWGSLALELPPIPKTLLPD